MTAPATRTTLDSVQALRGLAAMLVVIYHVTGVQKDELIPGPWERGYAGVDMFFVISGFILTYITHTYTRSLQTAWRFLYARATRVYPLWWIFASVLPLYFLMTYGSVVAPGQPAPASGEGTYLAKSLLLWPQSTLPVLSVGWTLVHEVFFYLVFSLALLLRRPVLPFLLAVWAGLTLAGSWLLRTDSPVLDLVTSQLTLEFIAGAFVGLAIRQGLIFLPRTLLLLGVAGLIAGMILFTREPMAGLPLMGRVAVYTLPCCAILYGSVALEQQRGLQVPGWSVALGNWSYALYLAHLIVMIGVQRLSRMAEGLLPQALHPYVIAAEPGLWGNLVFSLAVIALSIVTAALVHRYLESPLLDLTRKIIRRPVLAT
jgi:peptidoglycan/LPS O-acetylase OafA/YrhL